MTEQEWRRHYNQTYRLPLRLERARAKVRDLEAQALRLGMPELIEPKALTGEAGPR